MPQSLALRLALTTALSLIAALPAGRARACGGCFAPSGQASPVVAHRMAVLLAEDRMVLWDQFEYDGDPSEFVWVLPVMGSEEVELELSEDDFFQQLSSMTQVQLSGPFLGGGGSGRAGFACGGSAASSSGVPDRSVVTVYREETVGPYETAVIGSDDPDALVSWLLERGYQVGDEMLPIIAYYVRHESNFLALRIAPDAHQKRIQPVRVTCPVGSDTLPLRMVTAGVRSSVALELFVFGDRRYEAANFVNVEVDRAEITYSTETATYNYDQLASAALAQRAGEVWLTEFARALETWEPNPAVSDGEGGTYEAASDWAVVTQTYPSPYLTRMRAVLPVGALEGDLALQASLGGDLSETVAVTRTAEDPVAAAPSTLPPVSALIILGAGLLGLLRRRV